MKNIIYLLGLLTAASVLSAKEVVKIGILLPLTGESAAMGEQCKAGLDVLKDELKARETAFEYKFIVEDDQLAPKLSAAGIQKLLRVDKVDALVPTASAAGNIAKPFVEIAHVPSVANGASDPSVANGSYSFTNAARADKQALMFLETLKKLGYKKLGILSVQQQGALAIRAEVVKRAAEYGVTIVADEHFLFGEKDFRTLWLKIREGKPELVLVQGFDPEFPIMWRHYKQMGLTLPVASIEWFNCSDDWESIPENSWQVGSAWTAGQGDFAKAVAVKNPRIRNLAMTAYTYDSVGILVNAFEAWAKTHKNGKPTGKEIAELLHTTPYTGAIGSISVDKQGVMDSSVGLWRVKNGLVRPCSFEELKASLGK